MRLISLKLNNSLFSDNTLWRFTESNRLFNVYVLHKLCSPTIYSTYMFNKCTYIRRTQSWCKICLKHRKNGLLLFVVFGFTMFRRTQRWTTSRSVFYICVCLQRRAANNRQSSWTVDGKHIAGASLFKLRIVYIYLFTPV